MVNISPSPFSHLHCYSLAFTAVTFLSSALVGSRNLCQVSAHSLSFYPLLSESHSYSITFFQFYFCATFHLTPVNEILRTLHSSPTFPCLNSICVALVFVQICFCKCPAAYVSKFRSLYLGNELKNMKGPQTLRQNAPSSFILFLSALISSLLRDLLQSYTMLH